MNSILKVMFTVHDVCHMIIDVGVDYINRLWVLSDSGGSGKRWDWILITSCDSDNK